MAHADATVFFRLTSKNIFSGLGLPMFKHMSIIAELISIKEQHIRHLFSSLHPAPNLFDSCAATTLFWIPINMAMERLVPTHAPSTPSKPFLFDRMDHKEAREHSSSLDNPRLLLSFQSSTIAIEPLLDVLDGLDECHSQQLDLIELINSADRIPLLWLGFSRPEWDLRELFLYSNFDVS
jgi:hypothetical protein